MNAESSMAGKNLLPDEFGHFINGQWCASDGGGTIDQINPATGAILSRIQAGTPADVARAAKAARAAFASWSQTTAQERQAVLIEIAARIKANADDLGRIESMNNGKTLGEAMFLDVPESWGQFELFAGAAHSLHGETRDYPNSLGLVHREALGVIAQIIPWNVPLAMASMKLAPALAAGNTVILKPAETTSLSVLKLVELIGDIVPPGVINVVTGYGHEIGEALVTNEEVRKVAFTGSTGTARKIIQYAAHNIIPQTLELGGKSANIICADADLDAAANIAALSTVFNKGEVCMAGSRVFVHRAVKEEFLHKFRAAVEAVSIGDPLAEGTGMGAMASRAQFEKVQGYFDLAREEGASILTGGEAASVSGFGDGLFLKPTIIDQVKNDMRIAQEEIFGPVTCVLDWEDEEEVLNLANASRYGLAGAIWTKDLKRAHLMARGLETGIIWVNNYYDLPRGMPVGGYKQSGYGREYAWDVLKDYTITKSVVINLAGGL